MASNVVDIEMPTEMNEDIAWFFGYLWGNGSMSPNKKRIRFIDGHMFNLERVQKILREQFGRDVNILEAPNKKAWTLDIGSTVFWEWIVANGLFKYTEQGTAPIPYVIRASSWLHVMAFLAGLFDSDGCVHASPSGRTTLTFSHSGKEQYFTRHVQDVALSLGLVLGHSLNTKGENFQESKSIVLMNLAANSDEEAVGELSRLMGKVEHFASDSGLPHANNSGYTRVLGKVVSVEKIGPMETYDVEVENSHWYYAGAVKSHNTASLVLGT
ncbi:MAG: hypothetical protein LC650_04905, partial [Actinobacteria bacterium]|nr:hypothetical protein [Actinomycetota bacterium]